MRIISILIITYLVPFSALAELKQEEVSYSADSIEMKGYLVYDDKFKGERPGVIVVHEWWGHNEYVRTRAAMLAKLGYTALAIDMYGDGKTAAHPEDAGKFSKAVMSNLESAKSRFNAGLEFLKAHETTDKTKTSAIGYCFGGGVVLHMARLGVELDGVASFHGSLGTSLQVKPGDIKSKIVVFNGADDPFVKREELEGFVKEMQSATANFKIFNYPGAKHSFTSPAADNFGKKFNLPLEYNESADEKSWAELKVFLKEVNS